MRAPISVVMATMNTEAVLPAQLLALGEGHDEGLIYEIIMVDGGSSDLTRMIAAEAGAEIVRGPREAEAALLLGARMASGECILFAAPGSALTEGWTGQVLTHLAQTPDIAGALPAVALLHSRWGFLHEILAPHELYLAAAIDETKTLSRQLVWRLVRR